MVRPLDGVRILDLSRVLSGPYATMILADLGAEVIKLERMETGDIARGNGPYINGLSSYFLSLNRGKKSVTIDLASEKGKRILLGLVKHADVLVENFVPGTMKRLGLDYKVLRRQNPGIIYAACSGFGQTGPYAKRPALDVIVQGMGGIMSITGEPGGPPLRPGVSLAVRPKSHSPQVLGAKIVFAGQPLLVCFGVFGLTSRRYCCRAISLCGHPRRSARTDEKRERPNG